MQKTRNPILRLRLTKFRSGVVAVEMAIVVPLFILLIFGLVEFVRMGMVKQALTDAARAGCRKAALVATITPTDVETIIRNHLQTTINNSNNAATCRVSITPSDLNGLASGSQITASVEVSYADVSWFTSGFLQSTVLRGQSSMRRE
ncbi:MAG: TadE family protein [Planctomycetota bacterium]